VTDVLAERAGVAGVERDLVAWFAAGVVGEAVAAGYVPGFGCCASVEDGEKADWLRHARARA
jgi:hypothetical protein